ncbi:hypothetical protein ACWGET_20605 [Streptomyces zaomyceticus]
MLLAAIPGQASLFPATRTLHVSVTAGVAGRILGGEDLALAQAQALASQYGLSRSWLVKVMRMVWLALAVRTLRECEFLPAHGLLVIASELHRDRDQAWVERTIAGLPDRLANEVEAWMTVLRGEGPRRHPARS